MTTTTAAAADDDDNYEDDDDDKFTVVFGGVDSYLPRFVLTHSAVPHIKKILTSLFVRQAGEACAESSTHAYFADLQKGVLACLKKLKERNNAGENERNDMWGHFGRLNITVTDGMWKRLNTNGRCQEVVFSISVQWTCVRVWTCLCVRVRVRACLYIYVRVRVRMRGRACVCMCVGVSYWNRKSSNSRLASDILPVSQILGIRVEHFYWNCNAMLVLPKIASCDTVGFVKLFQEVSRNSFTKSRTVSYSCSGADNFLLRRQVFQLPCWHDAIAPWNCLEQVSRKSFTVWHRL